MNKNLSNLAYFRRGIALAAVVLTALVAAGNALGFLPTPWEAYRISFFGTRTGLGNTALAFLGEGRNPLVVGVVALVAWLLLPRERDYSRAFEEIRDPAGERLAELQRTAPGFELALAGLVPIAFLFIPAFVNRMGYFGGVDLDVGWWVVTGAACAALPFVVLAAFEAFVLSGLSSVRWMGARLSFWTAASMATSGAALVGLCFTGWAALAVLAGALAAASPRYISPPVLWILRRIFPSREPLPQNPVR